MSGWEDAAFGFGSAVPMAIKGFQDAEDNRYRRMEIEAKLRAQDDNQRRQEMLDRWEMEKNSPERRREQMKFELAKSGQEGQWDESGNFIGARYRDDALRKSRAGEGGASDPYGLKRLQAEKLRGDLEKSAFEKTPQGKLQKLSGDQRKRFDETVGTLNALTDLSSAYEDFGEKNLAERTYQMSSNPIKKLFSGDTPYTEASGRFKEFLGRLQSGGAITTDERQAFASMIPEATDSPKIAREKIKNLEFELGNRLNTFGIPMSDASEMGLLKKGLVPKGLLKDQNINAQNKVSGMLQGAEASAKIHPKANEALEFAKKNPNDPRAAEILRRLGK